MPERRENKGVGMNPGARAVSDHTGPIRPLTFGYNLPLVGHPHDYRLWVWGAGMALMAPVGTHGRCSRLGHVSPSLH